MAWIQFWNCNETSDITMTKAFFLLFFSPIHLIQLYWHYRAGVPDSQRHETEMECGPPLLTLLSGDSCVKEKQDPSRVEFMSHIDFVLEWVRFDLARPLPLMASSARRRLWSHVSMLGLADIKQPCFESTLPVSKYQEISVCSQVHILVSLNPLKH